VLLRWHQHLDWPPTSRFCDWQLTSSVFCISTSGRSDTSSVFSRYSMSQNYL